MHQWVKVCKAHGARNSWKSYTLNNLKHPCEVLREGQLQEEGVYLAPQFLPFIDSPQKDCGSTVHGISKGHIPGSAWKPQANG